jgi:DNA modification methylase
VKYERGKSRTIEGDCLEVMGRFPADRFHCCTTSPPYFALRSYLDEDHPDKPLEIGSEPTPEQFIDTMVTVFGEVKRVLHPSGLLFLNMGDSYGGVGLGYSPDAPSNLVGSKQSTAKGSIKRNFKLPEFEAQVLNMPHRVAEALRDDGWIWRQTIIWAKPNPMPETVRGWRWEPCMKKVSKQKILDQGRYERAEESGGSKHSQINPDWLAEWEPCPGCDKCKDHDGFVLRKGKGRCTSAYEFIFVMAKSDQYFWDSEAFYEKGNEEGSHSRGMNQTKRPNFLDHERMVSGSIPGQRNPRSVWSIPSEASHIPHFASYPSEMVRRCVQAATSDGGCCASCKAPYAPVVERRQRMATRSSKAPKEGSDERTKRDPLRHISVRGKLLGYKQTCNCEASGPIPCTVFDPFLGTGTTSQTAVYMGRNAVGIELNPEYVTFAREKIRQPPAWWLKRKGKSLSEVYTQEGEPSFEDQFKWE